MARMNFILRIKFWSRNGFDFFEAVNMSLKPFSRKILVELKKIRIENEQRKKYQQTILFGGLR